MIARGTLVAAVGLASVAHAQSSDGGCALETASCVSTRCCAGLACQGGEALQPTCRKPELTDAGCLAPSATCVSVELDDGGSYLPTCCGAYLCQEVGVAGTPPSCRTPPISVGAGVCHCSQGEGLMLLALLTVATRRRRPA